MTKQIIKVFVGLRPAILPSPQNHNGVREVLGRYGAVTGTQPLTGFTAGYKLESRCDYEITFNAVNNQLLNRLELDTPYAIVNMVEGRSDIYFSLSISEEKKAELMQSINDF